MAPPDTPIPLTSFITFGDLLKFLRHRARMTQRELSIAVGYSEAQISRLEKNQRAPDLAALMALFIPALYLEDEPAILARLMHLAAQARGETPASGGPVSLSRIDHSEITETTRVVDTSDAPGNLPLSLTSFVGRQRELAEIRSLLQTESHGVGRTRLLTLTGSGGSGKTRLALETGGRLVDHYRDGVWLVELASISLPELVLQAVTSTLGIPESRDDQPTSTLIQYLASRQLLLILDNCEHVIESAARLCREILQNCPLIHILSTSREILDIAGEVRLSVPPLQVSVPAAERNGPSLLPEAVQLFAERAQAVRPAFVLTDEMLPAVERICRLVDGIPLAIELAAARTAVITVEQIATRLEKSLQILSGGRSPRLQHQTLEATIEWSCDLLSNEERAFLLRLSVFAGGWSLEAAESVASDGKVITEDKVLDLLSQLINKSLVVVDLHSGAEARYRLLRIVRQYCYERLGKLHEVQAVQIRHLQFLLKLVEQANAGLMTPQSPLWLKRLDVEQDNLRAALAFGLSTKQFQATLQLAGCLFWFWQTRGHISEGRSQLELVLAESSESLDAGNRETAAARAKALWAAGSLAWIQADYAAARARIDESISLWRQIDSHEMYGLGISLREAGIIATYQGDLEYAHSVLTEAVPILQETAPPWDLALALYNQGLVYESQGDFTAARKYFQNSLVHFRELGEPWGLSVALAGFGRIAGRQGEYAAASTHLEESLELSQTVDDPWSNATTLYLLGEVARLEGDLEGANRLYAESLLLNQVVGDRALIGYALHNLGTIAGLRGDIARAAQLYGAAQAVQRDSTNTTSWSLTDHSQRQHDIAALRASVEDKTFQSAWIKGASMTQGESIKYALV